MTVYIRRWVCNYCGCTDPGEAHWRTKNKHPDKSKCKRCNTARCHNLPYETYTRWLAAGCMLCGVHEALCIDHDHTCCSGTFSCGTCVRGLLCYWCNMLVAALESRGNYAQEAFKYIAR